MRMLVSIGHPAHVHLFKNLIWALEKHGHEIKIAARDKEIVLYLLDCYDFDYTNVCTSNLGICTQITVLLTNFTDLDIQS